MDEEDIAVPRRNWPTIVVIAAVVVVLASAVAFIVFRSGGADGATQSPPRMELRSPGRGAPDRAP